MRAPAPPGGLLTSTTSPTSKVRAWARRHLSEETRRALRRFLAEAPHRARDLPGDLADRFRRDPLPPAALRARVGLSSSRREYREGGALLARDLLAALNAVEPGPPAGAWLDFGCGCGRVARALLRLAPIAPGLKISGVDVDRPAVEWCRRHLPGTFTVGAALPPLALPGDGFDLVYAVSVFTHLDEPRQDFWLAEMIRLLRPGGLLLASTHAPVVLDAQHDVTAEQRRELDRHGFLFVPGSGPFNENRSFHSRPYLEAAWGRWLDLELHLDQGLAAFQDLSVWRKPA